MNDLQSLKQQIQETGFSAEAKRVLLEILDKALVAGGKLSPDDKKKLLNIIQLEVDKNEAEADASDQVAASLERFVQDLDIATETAERRTDHLSKQAGEEAKNLEEDINSATTAH